MEQRNAAAGSNGATAAMFGVSAEWLPPLNRFRQIPLGSPGPIPGAIALDHNGTNVQVIRYSYAHQGVTRV